jgi:hypothetical protein
MPVVRPSTARTAFAVLAAIALLSACGSDQPSAATTAAKTARDGAPAATTSPTTSPAGADAATTAAATGAAKPQPGLGSATAQVEPTPDRTATDTGDSGGSRTSPAPPAAAPAGPSKDSFIAFADGVCTRFRADVAQLDRSARATEPGYRARGLSELFGAAVDELTTRPRPRADRPALRAYLLRLVDQRKLLEQLADAAERKDATAADALRRQVDDVATAARAKAQTYGLVICGSAD